MPLLAKPRNYKGSEVLAKTLKPSLHWCFDVSAEVEDPDPVEAATHKAMLIDNL